ncbi:MAG: 50S ribosomal protein L13 [Alphaproteobacteria bacterium MarineAlpha9_Bin4]|nr:50S ribosomal protein L13 [Pelagibacterales bacterium]PPR25209.1 MAG: 50S ribosomal protein L13 [Alphaproteobacteria bacterium MarineAlpha9_Bin4]|tara:strand:- start:1875 stop:2354 length:480 start_codon:yes stop_codon:yes gene_type:complete
MSTNWISKTNITRKWFIIDGKDLVLGRLSSYLAFHLMGKHKTIYSPNLDCGDNFIVTNADKVIMTGNKLEKKMYRKHTGYPGGLKETSYEKILNSKYPERVLKLAVRRMLPKGSLGREQIKKLHIYGGNSHPHNAQNPEIVDFKSNNKKNSIGKKIVNG